MVRLVVVGMLLFSGGATAIAGAAGGPCGAATGVGGGGIIAAVQFEGGQPAFVIAAINGGGSVRVFDGAGKMVANATTKEMRQASWHPTQGWDIIWVGWTPESMQTYRIEVGGAGCIFKTN